MKRNLKAQIEEILNTMSDAEIELEQMISDKNEEVLSVVADLQDTAIQIGNVRKGRDADHARHCLTRHCRLSRRNLEF